MAKTDERMGVSQILGMRARAPPQSLRLCRGNNNWAECPPRWLRLRLDQMLLCSYLFREQLRVVERTLSSVYAVV